MVSWVPNGRALFLSASCSSSLALGLAPKGCICVGIFLCQFGALHFTLPPAWLLKPAWRGLCFALEAEAQLSPGTTGCPRAPGATCHPAYTCHLRPRLHPISRLRERVGERQVHASTSGGWSETCRPSNWARKVQTLALSRWGFRSVDTHVKPRS